MCHDTDHPEKVAEQHTSANDYSHYDSNWTLDKQQNFHHSDFAWYSKKYCKKQDTVQNTWGKPV